MLHKGASDRTLGRLGVRRRHGGHTAIDRCGKKSRSGIMAPWAPYVCVRVIGSVAPASRKQLIPTDGCCSTTTTTTFQPDPFQHRVPGGGQIENSKKQRTDVCTTTTTKMTPRVPPLGSLAVQSPSQSSQVVHVSPATCHNLSLFKGSFSSFWTSLLFRCFRSLLSAYVVLFSHQRGGWA